MSKEPELIALATVNQDGTTMRGKIPAPLVKALKAKAGDVLAFERQTDGTVIVRKSTTVERKPPVKASAWRKGAKR